MSVRVEAGWRSCASLTSPVSVKANIPGGGSKKIMPKERYRPESEISPEERREIIRVIEEQLHSPEFQGTYANSDFDRESQWFLGVGVLVDRTTGALRHIPEMGNSPRATKKQTHFLRTEANLAWIFMKILASGRIEGVNSAEIFPPSTFARVNILEAVKNYNHVLVRKH